MTRVWSFDVFDTLIARSFIDPIDVFVQAAIEVSKEYALPIKPEVYATERYQAERRLLEKGEYPQLDAISFELANWTGLSRSLVDSLIENELKIERRGFWPIPKNVQEVEIRRRTGSRIIFISDTYLSSVFLKSVLCDFGIARSDELVFVSCEHGDGKKSGRLFVKVAGIIGVAAADITHYGDSYKADVSGAKAAGVTGRWVNDTSLNKYETTIRKFVEKWPVSTETRMKVSYLAGALRKVRLNSDSNKSELFDVAAGVAGPLLFFFVRNALQWAKSNKVDRLYFISRDGEILMQIAHLMTSGNERGPELRYLNVSRVAALLASLNSQADADQLRSLVLALRPCSIKEFVDYVAGKGSRLLDSYASEDLDKSTSHIKIHRMIQPFFDDPSLYDEVVAYNKDRRELFHAYLVQEGVQSNDAQVALIDVGWRLTIHELIARAVISLGSQPPSGFYFGIDRVSTNTKTGLKEAYMWDSRARPNWMGIEGVTRIIEVFCTAEQGRVIGYERKGGVIHPIFSDSEIELYKDWGLAEVRSGIKKATETIMHLKSDADIGHWERLLLRDLVAQFWSNPSIQEVHAWGTYPFEITSVANSQNIIPLYVPSSLAKRISFLFRHGSWRGDMINSWAAASEKMTFFPVRLLLKLMMKFKGILGGK